MNAFIDRRSLLERVKIKFTLSLKVRDKWIKLILNRRYKWKEFMIIGNKLEVLFFGVGFI